MEATDVILLTDAPTYLDTPDIALATAVAVPAQRNYLGPLPLPHGTWSRPAAEPRARAKADRPPRDSIVVERKLGYLIAKRCVDIVGSAIALVLLSPVMLLAAVVIKCADWGPVFYRQKRVGLGGDAFTCLKFRSMVVDADNLKFELEGFNSHNDSKTFKIPNDPRVTWFGRLMRRTSIDELPQLFNVLVGDMSLVGPRPPVPREVQQYDSFDMRRLAVRPGLTCIWQVSGRSRLPFSEQLRLDLEYIENRSFWGDFILLIRTVPAVLSADGAY